MLRPVRERHLRVRRQRSHDHPVEGEGCKTPRRHAKDRARGHRSFGCTGAHSCPSDLHRSTADSMPAGLRAVTTCTNQGATFFTSVGGGGLLQADTAGTSAAITARLSVVAVVLQGFI